MASVCFSRSLPCSRSRASQSATFDSRRSISAVRSPNRALAGQLFDIPIELRLPLIQLAMPLFNGRFALLKLVVPLFPAGAVAVECGEPLLNFVGPALQLGSRLSNAVFLLRECFLTDCA